MRYVSNANTFVCLSSCTHGALKSGGRSTTKREKQQAPVPIALLAPLTQHK